MCYINLLEIFEHCSHFFSLKPNISKCEIISKGVLKGVKVALCGMRCSNLHEDTTKMLGIHYSYNKQLENDENFKKYVTKIENVLQLRKSRNLSLEGNITIFKSLALSKITHLAIVKIDQLNKIQKNFIWNWLNPKIKNSTVNNDYENAGFKNVNIAAKTSSLQCSWIKDYSMENSMTGKSFHVIPYFGKNFVFNSNLQVNTKLTRDFPKCYRKIINTWSSKFHVKH